MKVLHMISGGDKGGAKTHVFTLLSALIKEIDLKIVCFSEGVFYNEIKKMPIPSFLIEQKHRFDLSVVKKLLAHIRENRYNIIHAHGARANFLALVLKRYIKIPIITTIHSDYKLDFTETLYKRVIFTGLNSFSLRFMDYYIAVSGSFKNMLVKRSFPSDRIYTVYNAIDFSQVHEYTEKSEFLSRYGINGDGKLIAGIIGRFDKVKGHDVFLRAAAETLKKRQDLLFLLAGDGPERANLEKLANSLGISEHVVFLGHVQDIFSFINAIDINVLSSHSESFPYALLEGALMAKTTLSTAVGGIPDLIKDGETGLLCKPADPKHMSEKLLELAKCAELREEFGNALFCFARQNFSSDNLKDKHIAIYNDVMKRCREENKLFDVMLSGYYGFGNSGDDALQKAIIELLKKEMPDINIIVLSRKTKETVDLHKVSAINRYNFFAVNKNMKRSRVFVYGGGSLIQDVTSTKSLTYYVSLMFMAKRLGLKIALYANGIGPISRKRNEPIARKALNCCDYISLRDAESLDELKRLTGSTKNAAVTVDPAFSLERASDERLLELAKLEGLDAASGYFGISLRNWNDVDPRFVSKLADAIDRISEKSGLTPLYLAMQPSDFSILKAVQLKVKTAGKLIGKIYSATDYIGLLSMTSFIISMRLHTIIYGFCVNVPSIGLAYDPKVSALYEYINQKTYMDIANIDTDTLVNMACEITNNLNERKELLKLEVDRLKSITEKDAKEIIKLVQ